MRLERSPKGGLEPLHSMCACPAITLLQQHRSAHACDTMGSKATVWVLLSLCTMLPECTHRLLCKSDSISLLAAD